MDKETTSPKRAVPELSTSDVQRIAPPDRHGHNTIYLDSSITFEEYCWWAQRARKFEQQLPASGKLSHLVRELIMNLSTPHRRVKDVVGADSWQCTAGFAENKSSVSMHEHARRSLPVGEAGGAESSTVEAIENITQKSSERGSCELEVRTSRFGVDEAEWETAQRAARTVTWGGIFFLVTTDIIGPFSMPWAFAQLGYGPGAVIFLVFGCLSCYSAILLWKMFVALDSPRYPLRNYGDLAFRLVGSWGRVAVNSLQSFLLFVNVALVIVTNGQGLAQLVAGQNGNGFLCFLVAQVIFTLVGLTFTLLRSLKWLGMLSNLSVWLNLVVIISTIAAVYIYPPNFAANANFGITGPIKTSGSLPPGKSLIDNVNGVMNGVFAFGGATIFIELMAEMRRPFDFWKAILTAEIFITSIYLVFGLVVYSRQGQYAFNPAFQGISAAGYALQTLGNVLFFIASSVFCVLYANIGIKVFYAAILRDVFKLPPLETKLGHWVWLVAAPVYWAFAFILAAAVPQISNLGAFCGAACIVQFSYTFPPILTVMYHCKKDAILPEESGRFDPLTGTTYRTDSGIRRAWRGFKKQLLLNIWNMLYFLGAVAAAALGIWASVVGMIDSFRVSEVTPFGCHNPAG